MSDKKSSQSRRKLLKSIAAGSGAVVAGKSLPESWTRPVVDSVMLPAHAQTSLAQYTDARVAGANTDSGLGNVMDSLIPSAQAQPEEALRPQGPTAMTCLTVNPGITTANVAGLIMNEKGSAQVTAEDVPIAGDPVSMSINKCGEFEGLGQITVQILYADNNVVNGRYSIGGGGSNFVAFKLNPGSCSAPKCEPI